MEDIIAQLKAIRIPFESAYEGGYYYSNTIESPAVIGKGSTINDSLDDLIDTWRKTVAIIANALTPPPPGKIHLMPLFLKVLISTNEELRESCDLVRIIKTE